MDRRVVFSLVGARTLGVAAAFVGAGVIGISGAGPAFAAGPTPTVGLSVTPPFGEDGGGAPNPITGVETGTQLLISIGLGSQDSDVADFPAPTGTVTLSDSRGLITGCEAGPTGSGLGATALDAIAINPQNPLFSVGFCEVTFPVGTSGSDVLTVTYGGDSNNGSSTGTETLEFAAGPPPTVPETPFAAGVPLAAIGITAGAVVLRRRKQRRAERSESR